jgi:hypothetical protein
VCDAASLATLADGGDKVCFACLASKCATEVTACSTDCACAPAYTCLQQNSAGGINSGYSLCPEAVNALSSNDPALTMLAACAPGMCNAECFPSQ